MMLGAVPKKCAICGLVAADLVMEPPAQDAAEAAQRLGAAVGWRCPDGARCRKVVRGESLSDDRRFGNPVKFDPDALPEPHKGGANGTPSS